MARPCCHISDKMEIMDRADSDVDWDSLVQYYVMYAADMDVYRILESWGLPEYVTARPLEQYSENYSITEYMMYAPREKRTLETWF